MQENFIIWQLNTITGKSYNFLYTSIISMKPYEYGVESYILSYADTIPLIREEHF
jgi:hypothetical protein